LCVDVRPGAEEVGSNKWMEKSALSGSF